MTTSATLTIYQQPDRFTYQWYEQRAHEQQTGLPPVALLQTQTIDSILQERIERAVTLLNELLSQRHVHIDDQQTHAGANYGAIPPDAENGDPLQGLGRLIFRQLLPPALQAAINALAPGSQLTIATNATALPWEIALSDSGYLALNYAVSHQLLSNQLPRQHATRPTATWSALLIGNPTADLPHTAAEIEAVADLIEAMPGAAPPRILMQRRATKATVLQELAGGQYNLIHFAGHAQVEPDDPTTSGLRLAKGEILTAHELQQTLAGHPFVFLNGCESARSLEIPSKPNLSRSDLSTSNLSTSNRSDDSAMIDEAVTMHGLAHAFLQAGARGILGTHWPIRDSSSQEFAIEFYRALLQGEPFDCAVQQARANLQQRHPADPLWASFRLYATAGDRLLSHAQRIQRPGTILALDLAPLLMGDGIEHGEDLSRRIDQIHGDLASIVAQFHGQLLPTPTNELLAFFATTTAQNDTARAVHAAQAIVNSSERDTNILTDVISGIGISSGDLYWTSATSSHRATDTMRPVPALGQPVQRALELARFADSITILLDENAHKLLQRHTGPGLLITEAINLAPIDPGTSQSTLLPQVAFRLRTAESARRQAIAGLQPSAIDRQLPFVGRDYELSMLHAIWRQTVGAPPQRHGVGRQRQLGGHGHLVGITGEAGVGKSRLVQGFAAQLAAETTDRPPQWITLRVPSTYQTAPYEIIVQLLQTLLAERATAMSAKRAGAEFDATTLAALLNDLPGIRAGVQADETVALLCELFDLPDISRAVHHLDLQTRQRRLVHLLGTLLAEQTQHAPLLLWIDDLHWADESSLVLLDQLTAGLERLPIILLTTFRADGTWQPPWWHRRNYQQLHLDALDDLATTTLLSELLNSKELPASLEELVIERSGGHPLFAQELVTALVETSALVRDNSGWQLQTALHEGQIPGTIQRVLLNRMDTLPASAQRVLAVAAVIGNPADPGLLQAVLQSTLQRPTLEAALSTLEDRNLLYQSWGSDAYHFRHTLMRDVAYAGISVEERQRTHRRLAELLEAPEKNEIALSNHHPIQEMLAHHYFYSVAVPTTSGRPRVVRQSPSALRQKALHYLQQAGERAHQKYAARSAILHYRHALDLVATLPDADAIHLALLDRLGAAHEIVMELPEAIDALQQVYTQYVINPSTVAATTKAELARRIGRLYERQSDYEGALEWMQQGLAFLPNVDQQQTLEQQTETDERTVAAALHVRVGCVRYSQGNHNEAKVACERGLQLTEGLDAGPVQAEAHNLLGSIADLQGATAIAGEHYRTSLATYHALGNAYEVARVENNLALVCFRSGEWEEAKAHFKRGITFWQEIEDHYNLAFNRLNLSVIEMYQGDWANAEAGFRQALTIWQEANNQRWCALCYTNLGLLAIEQAHWDEARSHLEESRVLILQQGIHHFLPEVTYALAEVALGQGDCDRALALANEASDLAQSLEMKLEEAIALRTKGKVLLAIEEHKEANSAFQSSLHLLQAQNNRYEIARTLEQLSHLATAGGTHEQAEEYSQQAAAILMQIGVK